MHIAYISHEYPPDTGWGGIGTYTHQIARLVQANGHSVEVFTASFERSVSEVYDGVLTHRIWIEDRRDFPIRLPVIFSKQHEAKNFDIIECPELGAEAAHVKDHYPGIPLIVRLHTPSVMVTRLQNSYLPLTVKLRFVLGGLARGRIDLGYWSSHDKNQPKDPDFLITEKAEFITAPSRAIKDWAINFWDIDESRIKVIPNPYLPPNQLLEIPEKTESKRITFLGRLNVLKGLVSLTIAMPKVLQDHPDWKIRFIGKDERSHAKGVSMKQWMAIQLENFEEQVEWIEWIDNSEIPVHMQETDIVVIPSLFESFSYVCAEAMSAGRGIIGSKNGGMNELLKDAGILINPKSPRQISKALNRLIEDPSARISYGTAARKRLLTCFDPDSIAGDMVDLYTKAIH